MRFEEAKDWLGGSKHTSAIVGHFAQTPIPADGVGLVDQGRCGDEQTRAGDGDFGVQVVVGHVHSLLCVLAAEIRRSLLRARETPVRGAEGGLPHLAELVQDVRHLGLIGVVVHEDDNALLGDDHA